MSELEELLNVHTVGPDVEPAELTIESLVNLRNALTAIRPAALTLYPYMEVLTRIYMQQSCPRCGSFVYYHEASVAQVSFGRQTNLASCLNCGMRAHMPGDRAPRSHRRNRRK